MARSSLRATLAAIALAAFAPTFAQMPSRTRTVAFVLTSLEGRGEAILRLRTLAGGPLPDFGREVAARKWRWRQLAPALRLMWDPKMTLESEGDPLGDLARAMDDDHDVRFDRLPPDLRRGVLDMVARTPSVGGATVGAPGAGLLVAASTDRNLFLRNGDRTLSLEVSPPKSENLLKRLIGSIDSGPRPSEAEVARWRTPQAVSYGTNPAFATNLGTSEPEVYALCLNLVQKFLKEETERNLQARRRAKATLLRKLLGEGAVGDLGNAHEGRAFLKLPVEFRSTLESDIAGGYARYGFNSESDAIRWLSGATVDTQYVRVILDFPSGTPSAPVFLGFQPFPSFLVP